ncbi:hypothetical protein [Streptomyces flavalbus]|uniref:Uncharacterized protein n=1 Tax=Streptomyces flavalbus TaxID=2665155 RepID=A0ABW2WCF4_9ACTN
MPGTVLLIAAAPVGRGRLVDAASVLPVLAAVAPGVLAGADTANVVELADPLEPQAVLTRLRAAAAAPGPLTVFVTGQLHLDRRQRLPHLALARTTPPTVRYTAFPWPWFREELRLRAPGTTTLVADLHADADAWELLRSAAPWGPGRAAPLDSHGSGRPAPLDCGPHTAVYGRVAPPPPHRRTPAPPSYMRAVATILRSGHRPPVEQLHQQALSRLADEPDFAACLPLASAPPLPADPHAAISAAVRAGRHADADALAARCEQAAVRAHGPGAEEVLHWTEVRADLAMFAGDAARSCRTWLTVATARLAAGQAPDAPAVETAVDRAHHQWGRVTDPAHARELGPALAELRGRVPGSRKGALDHVRRQLRQLQDQRR